MRRQLRIFSLIVLLATSAHLCLAQEAASVQTQQTPVVASNRLRLSLQGKVIKVYDGDTVTLLDERNKKTTIRLEGIDAPELKQTFGDKSQQNLSRMVLDKQVTILWTKIDKYRRTVGTIMLDGRDVNIEQVKAGMAWHFKKYEDEQDPEDRKKYAAAELEARSAGLGLWKDPTPTAPGDWRADVKTQRWGPPPPAGTIIGNLNSKKYHRPDCPGYRDMAERNRIFFDSVAKAEAAGYKRAGNCPPEATVAPRTDASAVAPADSKPVIAKPVSKQPTVNTSSELNNVVAQIIGNKNSKIYHVPGCSTYDNVSEKNRVYFKNEAEAESAGYRKAKNCH